MRVVAFATSLLIAIGLLAAPPASASTAKLAAVGPAMLLVSLVNAPSGDAGADIRVTLLVNGKTVVTGTKRCVTGLNATPRPITIGWNDFKPRSLSASDRVAFKVEVRAGTIAEAIPCGSAGGGKARLSFNSTAAGSHFALRIAPNPKTNEWLRSDGRLATANGKPRAGTTKSKLSQTLGASWLSLGTWKLAR